MQDFVAIAVATGAAVWLAWTLSKRFFAPPCQPPGATGDDGFVPLDTLRRMAPTPAEAAGDPAGRRSR